MSESFAIHYPGEKGNSTLRGPNGLRKNIDDFLGAIHEETGVSFSRNEFIIKAIKHYLEYCLELQNKSQLVKAIEKT